MDSSNTFNQYDQEPSQQRKNQPRYDNSVSSSVNQYNLQSNKNNTSNAFDKSPSRPQTANPNPNYPYKSTSGLLRWEEPPVENTPEPSRNRTNKYSMDSNQSQQSNPNQQSQQFERQPQAAASKGNFYQQDDKKTTNASHQYQAEPKVTSKISHSAKLSGVQSGPSNPLQEQREEHSNTGEKIKNLESNLMSLQMERDNLNNELQKIENSKTKSGALIKKKQDLADELSIVQNNISTVKIKLRELNVLHPY